jgi:hypothetical protein
VIPPYREIEIDDVLYIGITKKQLGNIVATDSTYVDAPEKTLFFNFSSPVRNNIQFLGTVAK